MTALWSIWANIFCKIFNVETHFSPVHLISSLSEKWRYNFLKRDDVTWYRKNILLLVRAASFSATMMNCIIAYIPSSVSTQQPFCRDVSVEKYFQHCEINAIHLYSCAENREHYIITSRIGPRYSVRECNSLNIIILNIRDVKLSWYRMTPSSSQKTKPSLFEKLILWYGTEEIFLVVSGEPPLYPPQTAAKHAVFAKDEVSSQSKACDSAEHVFIASLLLLKRIYCRRRGFQSMVT